MLLGGGLPGAGAGQLRCTATSQATHAPPPTPTCTPLALTTHTGGAPASRRGGAPWGGTRAEGTARAHGLGAKTPQIPDPEAILSFLPALRPSRPHATLALTWQLRSDNRS